MRLTWLILIVSLCGAALTASEEAWLDVPFIRQAPKACGAASLAMVVDYWQEHGMLGSSADVQDIQRQLYVPERRGIPAESMQRYLQSQEFRVFTFSGQWTDVRHHVAQGRPLIVALKAGNDSFHYAVVTGASDTAILLNDPADRKLRRYSRADFEKKWSASGHWTLLAVPASP